VHKPRCNTADESKEYKQFVSLPDSHFLDRYTVSQRRKIAAGAAHACPSTNERDGQSGWTVDAEY